MFGLVDNISQLKSYFQQIFLKLSLGAIFFIIMYVVFIFYKEPEHLEEETIFKPSYVTKELDDFQYNHQCCGWTGPEDYAIPFPPSCCGRRYTNKKFRRCSLPYDRGCKAVYMDNVNTIKTWLVIGDLIRLLIMIALLLILSKYLNELIKQKNRFKCPEYIPDDPLELLYKSSVSPICICDDVENETKNIENDSILEKNLDENVTDSDDSEQKETEIFVGRIWSKETIPIKDTTNKSAIHKPKQVKKTKDPILDSRKVIIQDVDSEEEMIKKKDKDKK